jgi:hypothetical protein
VILPATTPETSMHQSAAPNDAPRPARPNPTLVRWASLIGFYGSQIAALESLIRDADELVKLKRAVRGVGLKPELLLAQ